MVKEMHVTVEKKKRTLAAWQHSICCNTEEDLTFLISAFFFSPLTFSPTSCFHETAQLCFVNCRCPTTRVITSVPKKKTTNAIAETSVSVDLTDAAEIT